MVYDSIGEPDRLPKQKFGLLANPNTDTTTQQAT
jgi:hypothetical protein